MSKWMIKNPAGTVILTLEGDFWQGCGPSEWTISDAAMQALHDGLMRHHDSSVSGLKHWHSHALWAMNAASRADFGYAIGQVMCAAEMADRHEREIEERG